MPSRKRIAGAFIALAMTACSAYRDGALPPGNPEAASPQAKADRAASAEIRLRIPKRHHQPRYVSASTQSITVLSGTKTLGTFDTAPSSGGCTQASGATVCSFKVGIATGTQTFTVNSYDAPGGSGHLLSSGSVTKTIVAGLNAIPVTLNGTVSAIVLAMQNPNPPAGTAASLRVTVMAQDADGNTIVGPGSYSVPIALTDSDKSGATSLTTSTVSGPGQFGVLQYAKSGSPQNLTSATIGATASGVTNVTTTTFAPSPGSVGSFVLPTTLGSTTGLGVEPEAIVSGPDGNLWLSTLDSSGNAAILRMTTSGTFTAYLPGTAPSTNLPNEVASGLTVGSDGNVWYVTQSNVGNINPTTGGVTNFPFSSLAGLCPKEGRRIVPAADGGLWFTVACKSSAELVHVTTSGSATVYGYASNFANVFGLVVGKDGNVYVAGSDNMTSGAIAAATVAGANVTGVTIVDVGNTGGSLFGIAQSADGDLWATNDDCSPSVYVRVHLAAGFLPSSATVFPTMAGCSAPANLLALADGSLWAPNQSYATISQIVPNAESAPSLFDLALPAPYLVSGNFWDVALGPDGYLYTTDANVIQPGFSSNIAKVAY